MALSWFTIANFRLIDVFIEILEISVKMTL